MNGTVVKRTVTMGAIRMAQSVGGWSADGLAEALTNNDERTKELKLMGTRLGYAGFKKVFEALAVNTSCAWFGVTDCNIDQQLMVELVKALRQNNTLQVLHLNCNPINNEGAKMLADVLKDNTSIKELYINGTDIQDEGARHIANMLMVNRTLEKVRWFEARITERAAEMLKDVVGQSSTLHTLSLGEDKYFISKLPQSIVQSVEDAASSTPTTLASSNFGRAYSRQSSFATVDELCLGVEYLLEYAACKQFIPELAIQGLAIRLQQRIRQEANQDLRFGAGLAWTFPDEINGCTFYGAVQMILRRDEAGEHMDICVRYCRTLNGFLVSRRLPGGNSHGLASLPTWAFENDAGNWVAFGVDDNKKLDDASKVRDTLETTELSFNKGFGTRYVFDFRSGTQTNTESKKVRKLQKRNSDKINGAIPEKRITTRGAWLPSHAVRFFSRGLIYRYAGYLASSDDKAIPMHFLSIFSRSRSDDFLPVIFEFHFDALAGCDHVNLLEGMTEVKDEREWLFQHYSAFKVRQAADLTQPTIDADNPLRIKLQVLPDNRGVALDVPLAQWH